MRLALLLFKYFPYGGLQRDFIEIARALQQRDCAIRIYCLDWQGEPLPGADLRRIKVRALSNHVRYRRFLERVRVDLAAEGSSPTSGKTLASTILTFKPTPMATQQSAPGGTFRTTCIPM